MKEKIKLSLFADDMIVYKRIDKKLPKLLIKSDYSNIAEFNVQKAIAFLYTSNEWMDFEIKNTVPFAVRPKKEMSFGIKQTKKNMYKIYIRKTKDYDDQNQRIKYGEIFHVYGLEDWIRSRYQFSPTCLKDSLQFWSKSQ